MKQNGNSGNMKNNGPAILEGINDFLNGINEINARVIKSDQSTLEKYLENKSKEIDQLIIEVEKSGLGTYHGGEVALVIDPNDQFHLEGEFYFQDKNNAWVKKSLKGKSISLDWAFIPDEQERLRRMQKIVYEYKKP